MRSALAPAKINLALVVGGIRSDGKHDVHTVMQRLELADGVSIEPAPASVVTGFPDDTLVREALLRLTAAAGGGGGGWAAEIDKVVPVAAGLGGGSSDAATALRLANTFLERPLEIAELRVIAGSIGADVPFFLGGSSSLGTQDGTRLEPLELPRDYTVLIVLPHDVAKTSTRDVYADFDARGGAAGFAARRVELQRTIRAVRQAPDLARLPPNDLASSALAHDLRGLGAFRADVSGAGPAVYGLFRERDEALAAECEMSRVGRTWVTRPV
jgi:4-diphosphocytidyl-2-C-methyl-D-erythritol kinase